MLDPLSIITLGFNNNDPLSIITLGFFSPEAEIIIDEPFISDNNDGNFKRNVIINIKYGKYIDKRYFQIPLIDFTKILTTLESAIKEELKIYCSISGESESKIKVTTKWRKNGIIS